MPFLASSEGCFWPLTASITFEVKNNHAHVTTQRILNKLIGIKFSIGCIVWFGRDAVLINIWLPCVLLIRYCSVSFQSKLFISISIQIHMYFSSYLCSLNFPRLKQNVSTSQEVTLIFQLVNRFIVWKKGSEKESKFRVV